MHDTQETFISEYFTEYHERIFLVNKYTLIKILNITFKWHFTIYRAPINPANRDAPKYFGEVINIFMGAINAKTKIYDDIATR